MEIYDPFEKKFHSIILPHHTEKSYEKRLLHVTIHNKYQILPVLEDFAPLIKDDRFQNWCNYLQVESYIEFYGSKRVLTSREKRNDE